MEGLAFCFFESGLFESVTKTALLYSVSLIHESASVIALISVAMLDSVCRVAPVPSATVWPLTRAVNARPDF